MLQTYNYINFVHDNPEKIVLKQLFSYQHPEGISQNAELSIGLGKRLFSYIVMDTEKRIPVALSFFEVEEWGEQNLALFLNSCSKLGPFSTVQVFFDSANQTLIPIPQYEKEVLQQQHQSTTPTQRNTIFLTESYADWQFYLGYSIPSMVLQTVKSIFPSCGYKHVLKPFLVELPTQSAEGTLCVDVTVQQINIALFRGQQLLFCGSINYSNEFDALYYLLKICREYSLTTTDIQLQLSGLIDTHSKLYAELNSYFMHIHFRVANKDCAPVDFPPHYFTLLTNNLRCVS